MKDRGWISVGEFPNAFSANTVSQRLSSEKIPNRVVFSTLPRRGPECWIWVPPEWVDKAKAVLTEDAVSEDELAKAALSYPPPDDADGVK